MSILKRLRLALILVGIILIFIAVFYTPLKDIWFPCRNILFWLGIGCIGLHLGLDAAIK